MRIINIVDSVDIINFGVWNAATATADALASDHGCEVELWYPEREPAKPIKQSVKKVLLSKTSISELERLIKFKNLSPDNDLIITHGCWQYATKWGAALKKKGFKWVYIPHGMLEPWSMSQKELKKRFYFSLIEKPLAVRADCIRAVGQPEYNNLVNMFPRHSNIQFIPNCVDGHDYDLSGKLYGVKKMLFMGRLHHKKGVSELAEAWVASKLNNRKDFKLLIAGPDQGELKKIEKTINGSINENIEYLGSVYGDEKIRILSSCHYFALPSRSEGFPTSIVEALSYGLVPMVSDGCNFPEVFKNNLGIRVSPEVDTIIAGLNQILELDDAELISRQKKGIQLFKENYTTKQIAKKEMDVYQSLLVKQTT